MNTFSVVLLAALLVLGYQLFDTRDQLQGANASLADSKLDFKQCSTALADQNQLVDQYADQLLAKNTLLKQSAAQQVNLVLRQQQSSSKDAADLNRWLANNFGDDSGGSP